MKILIGLILLIIGNQTITAQNPRVFVLDGEILQRNKRKILDAKSPDISYKAAIETLERDAQKLLRSEFASVVTKDAVPPSGDKHDYMSQAPYFWRNPKTADGLPYVRKDGERNPEVNKFPDHKLLQKMVDAVETLSIAYYFTNKEVYAAKATEILRMWFLDPATKMNPNLEFAQAIPGLFTGRGFGIIETRRLTAVVDAIGLLANAKSWTKTDQNGVEMWFTQFLKWLTTSKNGVDEAGTKNNHATHYDVQVVSFSLFLGKNDLAKSVLENAKKNRIATQIAADGSQPHELARTRSWSYSTMNLEGFVTLAKLGENVGIDLWSFQTEKSGGIRKSIEFLYPYLDGKSKWTYQQIDGVKPERLYPSIRLASRRYKDDKFKAIIGSIPKISNTSKDLLLN